MLPNAVSEMISEGLIKTKEAKTAEEEVRAGAENKYVEGEIKKCKLTKKKI